MWHVALVVPFLALITFFFLPWQTALAISIPVGAVGFYMYYLLARDMRTAPKVGANTLIGASGYVIGAVPHGGRATHLVRVQSEIWLARIEDGAMIGDAVKIIAVDGLLLIAKSAGTSL